MVYIEVYTRSKMKPITYFTEIFWIQVILGEFKKADMVVYHFSKI